MVPSDRGTLLGALENWLALTAKKILRVGSPRSQFRSWALAFFASASRASRSAASSSPYTYNHTARSTPLDVAVESIASLDGAGVYVEVAQNKKTTSAPPLRTAAANHGEAAGVGHQCMQIRPGLQQITIPRRSSSKLRSPTTAT